MASRWAGSRHVVRVEVRSGRHASHVSVYRRGNAGIIVREMAWVRELGDDQLAVVFQRRVAVVEFREAVAVDGDELFVVARATVWLCVV